MHGRTVFDLEMRTALESLKYERDKAAKDVELLTLCTAAVVFLLSIFHYENFNNFEDADRRLLLRAMPPDARRVISTFEADY